MNKRFVMVDDILSVLAGDAIRMKALVCQADIARAAESISQAKRTLTAAAVRRVLSALSSGQITSEQAQAWASFVRRGYLTGEKGPVRPIDIDYQTDLESAISEVVSRLDELGDTIDGTIDGDEIKRLFRKLLPHGQLDAAPDR